MDKGDVTTGYVAMALMKVGKIVLFPLTYNLRYDLLIDEGSGKFSRVQCKTGRIIKNGEVLTFNVCSVDWKAERHSYIGEVDYFGVQCEGHVYLVPVGLSKTEIYLRLKEPKRFCNNRDRPIRMAKDFEIGT